MTGRQDSAGQVKAAMALRKAQEAAAPPAQRAATSAATEARRNGAEANRRKADDFVRLMMPEIRQARELGNESCNAIAWYLNQQGKRTARNGAWTGAAVRAILSRAERLGSGKD